jgi:hypothetical protein
VRVAILGELTGLAGAQALLAIRLGVLPQVQEQVVLRAHWVEGYGPACGHQKTRLLTVWDQQSHHRQY